MAQRDLCHLSIRIAFTLRQIKPLFNLFVAINLLIYLQTADRNTKYRSQDYHGRAVHSELKGSKRQNVSPSSLNVASGNEKNDIQGAC